MFAPNDKVDETNGNTGTEEAKNDSTADSASRQETSEDGNEVNMSITLWKSLFSSK